MKYQIAVPLLLASFSLSGCATVKQNRRVVVIVKSALADEIHLHGYDLSKDVEAGGTIRIAFKATSRCRWGSSAWKTTPMPPAPSTLRMR